MVKGSGRSRQINFKNRFACEDMSKRYRHEATIEEPPSKRIRQSDRLSSLSDELLLNILSFLPIPSLITCQRLSRRFSVLTGDSELWKRKYYSRWIWPRARRIRNLKQGNAPRDAIGYSPKVSKWVNHGPLTKVDQNTNWKGQYRLQHNWSKGTCRVTEVEVAEPPISPVVIKLDSGVVFTADTKNGLRAWSMRDTKTCLASVSFSDNVDENKRFGAPTALAVTTDADSRKRFEVTVGFGSGKFAVYRLDCDRERPCFHLSLSYSGRSGSGIAALASCKGYLLVLSQNQTLALYQLYAGIDGHHGEKVAPQSPRSIASLTASNIQAPFSLSVRTTSAEVIASIAYSFPRIGCGWSVGLQELRWNKGGGSIGSRLATTVDSQFSGDSLGWSVGERGTAIRYRKTVPAFSISASLSPSLSYTQPPTSLSYSHPYLLASHADNTLTMYLVVSGADSLAIKTGRRLWGHTSSVSGVQVSPRGKAVSVSAKGDEMRIWELEDLISFRSTSRPGLLGDRSVQLSPERTQGQQKSFGLDIVSEAIGKQVMGLGPELAWKGLPNELTQMNGMVEFDDEQVIVLRQRAVGAQLLDCYDFT